VILTPRAPSIRCARTDIAPEAYPWSGRNLNASNKNRIFDRDTIPISFGSVVVFSVILLVSFVIDLLACIQVGLPRRANSRDNIPQIRGGIR
jgi:hypothetical protein